MGSYWDIVDFDEEDTLTTTTLDGKKVKIYVSIGGERLRPIYHEDYEKIRKILEVDYPKAISKAAARKLKNKNPKPKSTLNVGASGMMF